jgi:hypothetical protein
MIKGDGSEALGDPLHAPGRGRGFAGLAQESYRASPPEPAPSPAALAQRPSPTPSPPGPTLTLDQAFALAAQHDAAITAARLRRAVDQAGIDVAKERPNPELRYEQAKETPHQSLTGTQPIELGGKRGRRIEVAQAVARTGRRAGPHAGRRAGPGPPRLLLAGRGPGALGHRRGPARSGRRARDTAQERFDAGEIARLEVLQADLLIGPGGERGHSPERRARTRPRAELNVLIGPRAQRADPAGVPRT